MGKLTIHGHDGKPPVQALGYDHPVKRILKVQGEILQSKGILGRIFKQPKTAFLSTAGTIPF